MYSLSLWALLAATALSPRPLLARITDNESIYNDCDITLGKSSIAARLAAIERFKYYGFVPIPPNLGFHLRLRRSESVSGVREIRPPSQVLNFDPLSKKVWQTLDGKKFEFFNIGYRNFQLDSYIINRAVLTHILNHPDKNLIVYYDYERTFAEKVIKNHRVAVHRAVMDKYLERKPYVTKKLIDALVAINNVSDNSDTLALLSYENDPRNQVSLGADIKNRLLLTAQITYFGNKSYFEPTVESLTAAARLPVDNSVSKLPFEFRLDPRLAKEFRRKLYSRFTPHFCAEIIRTALFEENADSPLPKSVHDKFFLKILRQAEARKVKTLLINVDDKTARLFSQYGFRPYDKLPIAPIPGDDPTPNVDEYLYYLEVGGPLYWMTISKLTAHSVTVTEKVEEL